MYQPTKNQISSKFSDKTTILNHQAGMYYGLNGVGTYIWEILQKSPADFETLKSMILEKFEVDEVTCAADLKEILNELINAKLIEEI